MLPQNMSREREASHMAAKDARQHGSGKKQI